MAQRPCNHVKAPIVNELPRSPINGRTVHSRRTAEQAELIDTTSIGNRHNVCSNALKSTCSRVPRLVAWAVTSSVYRDYSENQLQAVRAILFRAIRLPTSTKGIHPTCLAVECIVASHAKWTATTIVAAP